MMSCRYGQIGMDPMNDTTEALTPVRFIVTIVIHSLGNINVAHLEHTTGDHRDCFSHRNRESLSAVCDRRRLHRFHRPHRPQRVCRPTSLHDR